MKLKIKVTLILVLCAFFTLALVKSFSKDAKPETMSTELCVAQKLDIVGTDNKKSAVDSANEVKVQNEKTSIQAVAIEADITEQPIEPVDVLDSIEGDAAEALENTLVTTLSISEPEMEFNHVLPKVNEYLNIRKEANDQSEVVGKLYKNSYATIIKRDKEWTKIESNGVTGYAHSSYLYFDEDAIDLAKSLDAFKATARANGVNIRQKPDKNSVSFGKTKQGDTFTHVPEMDTDDWTAVRYGNDNEIAYISSDFLTEKITLKSAISIEEERKIAQAKEEAKKQQAAQQAQKEESKSESASQAVADAKKHQPAKTNRAAIKVSDEDLFLLSVVVAMEAGNEPYEGQLAVANVVVNRMLNGYWGKTIPDVVYAKGQFSGANSGRIEKFSSRVSESNKRAAVEALAGNNNIGDYMFFIMKSHANYSRYKKYYILGGHCFYAR